MRGIEHVLARAYSMPWAIEPSRGQAIRAVLERRAAGVILSDEQIHAAIGEDEERRKTRLEEQREQSRKTRNVMVLPVWGVVLHRAYELEQVSSGGVMSMEHLIGWLRAALADPGISAVVLDIDSPGGTVGGVPEVASLILGAQKPVVAVANSMAASAAYWIASAAHELVVTPSGDVGSVGVWAMHQNAADWYKQRGVENTLLKAGKFKAEFNDLGPLTEDARAHLQESVDHAYDQFVKAVAMQRGEKVSTVRGPQFGEGRMFPAAEAVERGMADRVATIEETIARLAGGGRVKPKRGNGAELEVPAPVATEPSDPDAGAAELDLAEAEFEATHPAPGEAGAYHPRRPR